MSSNQVIKASGLQKVYHLYDKPSDRLKQLLYGERRHLFRSFVALDTVNLSMQRGDVVGIVGKNGSGKSTFLQLVCGTLSPSSGSVKVDGRIAALLELGAGFNPEFSGRENIYLAGAIAGLAKQEIEQRIASIIDFSGVAAFIDQPVKTYSSGMYVRLAFSIAISVDPDVLIIDEALSVGDGDFAKRSFDRIMDLKDRGKTILFCSHSLYQIESLCNRVIWLDKGVVRADGPPEVVVPEYQSFLDAGSTSSALAAPESSAAEMAAEKSAASQEAWIERVSVASTSAMAANAQGELCLESGVEDLLVDVNFVYRGDRSRPPGVALAIHSESGLLVTSCGSWEDGLSLDIDSSGRAFVQIRFKAIPLLKGRYRLGVILFCDRGLFPYEEVDPVAFFNVVQSSAARGLVSLRREWKNCEHIAVSATTDSLEASDTRSRGTAYTVRVATPADALPLTQLFEQVFHKQVSPAVWLKKYQNSLGACRVAETAKSIEAFYGVVERFGYLSGERVRFGQACDVMVSTRARNSLGRAGVFYQMAREFIEQHVGIGKSFDYAFGFPNERAYKVAEKLGLYRKADHIVELRWSVAKPLLRRYGWRSIARADRELVSRFWSEMLSDIGELAVGERSFERLDERFGLGETDDYKVIVLYTRFTGKVIGVAVIKFYSSESRAELLDIIAPRRNVPKIVAAVGTYAASHGLTAIFCWATPAAAVWLKDAPVDEEIPTEVIVPTANLSDKSYRNDITGKWWLLGGDTDFR